MKFLVIICMLMWGQGEDGRIRDIGVALKAGSSRELIKFCNQSVEIKIDGESSKYSRSHAEVILRSFFEKNAAKDFAYIHQGSSPEGLKYTIGRYTHDNGTYRVVMFIKKIGDNYLIDTLNFSKE